MKIRSKKTQIEYEVYGCTNREDENGYYTNEVVEF